MNETTIGISASYIDTNVLQRSPENWVMTNQRLASLKMFSERPSSVHTSNDSSLQEHDREQAESQNSPSIP